MKGACFLNILAILQLVAALLPGAADFVSKVVTAIHATPGTPEHTAAVTNTVAGTVQPSVTVTPQQ